MTNYSEYSECDTNDLEIGWLVRVDGQDGREIAKKEKNNGLVTLTFTDGSSVSRQDSNAFSKGGMLAANRLTWDVAIPDED